MNSSLNPIEELDSAVQGLQNSYTTPDGMQMVDQTVGLQQEFQAQEQQQQQQEESQLQETVRNDALQQQIDGITPGEHQGEASQENERMASPSPEKKLSKTKKTYNPRKARRQT